MTKFLLSVHVLAAILAVGSITVAASMFPRYALRALGVDGEPGDGDRAPGIAALLHRVCRAYAVAGLAVPVFGIATAAQLGVLTDAWLIASLLLTTIAAALLALAILPGQRSLLDMADVPDPAEPCDPADPADPADLADLADGGQPVPDTARATAARLAMLTGIFNVLWATVTVLMIVRPGSTTGA
ncbi:hypothetical protein [Streptomyces sp. Je 1-369]|uniref:hypothetical protein n=1 Tax=Streptomyces sp. Je 1-369 TaxID=2966192 RepID=UPI0022864CEE|nr:hypothetical protein [Streptomyces sp. Je 1-369]WAL96029.1 hypothetical protein NOO62_16945 [Streptomyces sp. Je 1-369]